MARVTVTDEVPGETTVIVVRNPDNALERSFTFAWGKPVLSLKLLYLILDYELFYPKAE